MKLSKEATTLIKNFVLENPISEEGIYPIRELDLFLSKKRLLDNFVDDDGEAAEIEIDGFSYWYVMSIIVEDTTFYLYGGTPIL